MASGARVLLLSHMLRALILRHGAADGKFAAGARSAGGGGLRQQPNGRAVVRAYPLRAGTGVIGCYSTQTYKHMKLGRGRAAGVGRSRTSWPRAVFCRFPTCYSAVTLWGPSVDRFEKGKVPQTPNVSGGGTICRAGSAPATGRPARAGRALETRSPQCREVVRNTPGPSRSSKRPEEESIVARRSRYCCGLVGGPGGSPLTRACWLRGVELKWFGAPEPVASPFALRQLAH